MKKNGRIIISFCLITALLTSIIIYTNYDNRVGKIHMVSEDSTELLARIEPLSFLHGNIQSCKWYYQIARKSGIIFLCTYGCINGEMVLENDYLNEIITGYVWQDFSYEESLSDDSSFIVDEMYKTSMIKDILKTKKLLICSDLKFQNSGFGYYTFLDKGSRKLYFYYDY